MNILLFNVEDDYLVVCLRLFGFERLLRRALWKALKTYSSIIFVFCEDDKDFSGRNETILRLWTRILFL